MLMTNRCSLSVIVAMSFVPLASAADVESGPTKGEAPPALKLYDVTGPQQGKTLDYVKARQQKPTIYVVIPADKWSRPMHRFVKALGEAVDKKHKDGLVVAVWLTDDKQKTKDYLPQISDYYKSTALAYYPGKTTGPGAWGINDQADVTVVVTNKGKVLSSGGYQSVNATVVPEIMKTLGQSKK